jgi:hypothetical protein
VDVYEFLNDIGIREYWLSWKSQVLEQSEGRFKKGDF